MESLIVKLALTAGAILIAAVLGFLLQLQLRYVRGRKRAEQDWRQYQPPKLPDFGSTRSLSILPLADWHTSQPELLGEMGVSYLIETDHGRILFDVGFNSGEADPSPLLHNMRVLGVELSGIDTIVISHKHLDHVGGRKWEKRASFSLGNDQLDLSDKRVFTPIKLSYPGIEPVVAKDPLLIAPGVATTGTIARQLLLGWVDEQALAVNVEGKGIVLIVGCGHQTMRKLLDRARQVFSEPIFGLVGGLHYPVPQGRLKMFGLNVQRLLAAGDGLFNPLTEEEVTADIEMLLELNPGLVAVSGHDSSDEMIERFRQAFGPAHRHVRVGERIVVAG